MSVMSNALKRFDPADRYYRAVQIAEKCSNALFFTAGILSFTVLFLNKDVWIVSYQTVEIAFSLAVIGLFVIGSALRLYWMPRAEEQRRLGFFSDTFQVPLTHEQTVNFYNNPEIEPITRLGYSLMENSFFSRAVSLTMLMTERAIVAVYIIAFMIALLVRSTDLAVVAVAAQVVFSEQIISRWLRLEWLRIRCDATYNRLYELFQSHPFEPVRTARIIDALTAYEAAKANAGITLSSRIFYKLNPKLSKEWEAILTALKRTKKDQP